MSTSTRENMRRELKELAKLAETMGKEPPAPEPRESAALEADDGFVDAEFPVLGFPIDRELAADDTRSGGRLRIGRHIVRDRERAPEADGDHTHQHGDVGPSRRSQHSECLPSFV